MIINADSDDENDDNYSKIDDDDNDEKVAPAFVSSSGMEPRPPSPLTTTKTRGNMRGNISGKSKLRSATIICTYMKKVEFKYIWTPFLSDPSPIFGYACHSLTDWLTAV